MEAERKTEYRVIEMGLRIVGGAWSQLQPTLARVGERDDEIHAAVSKISDGLADLDRLIRRRLRSAAGHTP